MKNPATIVTNQLPAVHIPIGLTNDYKPMLAQLPSNGDLLLTAFAHTTYPDATYQEDILLWRSQDGGRTWSERHDLGLEQGLYGREPYLTVLRDGTLLMTSFLLDQDLHNTNGYGVSLIRRSTDSGRTWTTARIGPDGLATNAIPVTTRNVLQLNDGTVWLGVSGASTNGPHFVWSSSDGGANWVTNPCTPVGFSSQFGFFGEGVFWLGHSDTMYCFVRVDSHEYPIADEPVPAGNGDNTDHLVLYRSLDNGLSFNRVQDVGYYGEMYPSVLRLLDGRLLLTFTVRDLNPPLGVNAVVGSASTNGLSFRFDRERIMIDDKTPMDKVSGGGFGNTIQLIDGTLVTAYSYRGWDNNFHVEVVRWRLP